MLSESHNSYMPKYVQIQNYILQRIEEGTFSVGDKIPSEAELSRQFAVSRITVNTAIKDLASKGVVERIQGKGTFIRDIEGSKERQSMAFASGIKLPSLEESVKKPHKLVEHGVIQAGPRLCRKMGLEEGVYVYKIVRSVSRGDQLDELDYSYIPLSVCSNHTFDCEALEYFFLHDYICKHFGSKPTHMRILIHTQMTEDMDVTPFYSEKQEELFIWDTFVHMGEQILGLTTTVSVSQENKLFITLEL